MKQAKVRPTATQEGPPPSGGLSTDTLAIQARRNGLSRRWLPGTGARSGREKVSRAMSIPPVPASSTNSWARPMVKVLGIAEQRGARIIGITGSGRGVGVSSVAHEIATSYPKVGKTALLVRADRIESLARGHADTPVDTLHLEPPSPTQAPVATWDMAATPGYLTREPQDLRRLLEDASRGFSAAVIDLPPISRSPGTVDPVFSALGAVCDLVFLICVTGSATKLELTECMELSKIAHVNVAALILNDWKMPAATVLSGIESPIAQP